MQEEYEGFNVGFGEGIGFDEICQDVRPDIITNEEEWI